jgi:hypothetical protein
MFAILDFPFAIPLFSIIYYLLLFLTSINSFAFVNSLSLNRFSQFSVVYLDIEHYRLLFNQIYIQYYEMVIGYCRLAI